MIRIFSGAAAAVVLMGIGFWARGISSPSAELLYDDPSFHQAVMEAADKATSPPKLRKGN